MSFIRNCRDVSSWWFFVCIWAHAPGFGQTNELIYVHHEDGNCERNELVSKEYALKNRNTLCAHLGEWGIARIGSGASLSGSRYKCEIKDPDTRSLALSMCYVRDLAPTISSIQLAVQKAREMVSPQFGKKDQLNNWLFEPLTKADSNTFYSEVVEKVRSILEPSAKQQISKRYVSSSNATMKYKVKSVGLPSDTKKPLIISMHGGGGTTKAVNNEQWDNQINLYNPIDGYYIAPRAPEDTWNMWFGDSMTDLLGTLIVQYVFFKDVDPNRVYLIGYSAGGDGVYRIGPRLADYFAAISMSAGHPGNISPISLRNTGFMAHVGENDTSFNRSALLSEWAKMLDALEANESGYKHRVHLHSGKGHWMNGDDFAELKWLYEFKRTPSPTKIIWHRLETKETRHFWIGRNSESTGPGSIILAEISGQNISILSDSNELTTVFLNDDMVDLDQKITISYNYVPVLKGQIPRTRSAILEAMESRLDLAQPYTALAKVSPAKPLDNGLSCRFVDTSSWCFVLKCNGNNIEAICNDRDSVKRFTQFQSTCTNQLKVNASGQLYCP